MADKVLNFSRIKLIDDGIDFIIKSNNDELLNVDKITQIIKEVKTNEIKLNTPVGKATAGRVALDANARFTVETTAVLEESIIIITPFSGFPVGSLFISLINPGINFEIRSSDIADANLQVNWLLINPI